MKYSKNKKLNAILNGIKEDILQNLSISDLIRYMSEYKNELDYNIAQYGNLIVYYDDLRMFYNAAGYKFIERVSDDKLWKIYLRQVGWVAREINK